MVCVPTGTTSLDHAVHPDLVLDARSRPVVGRGRPPQPQLLRARAVAAIGTLSIVGLVGATMSALVCVVAVTTLLSCDTLPDGSIALTLNW